MVDLSEFLKVGRWRTFYRVLVVVPRRILEGYLEYGTLLKVLGKCG